MPVIVTKGSTLIASHHAERPFCVDSEPADRGYQHARIIRFCAEDLGLVGHVVVTTQSL